MLDFQILKKSKKSHARLVFLKTNHGVVETPCLVPVATQAVVKTLTSEDVKQTGSQILIANTFHLHLKPGEKNIKKAGGLHKFMNWPGPLMTDSGGFQVFSLGFGKDLGIGKILKYFPSKETEAIKRTAQPKSVKITPDGVYFQSPVDGKKLFLGPKESIKIQEQLGADIIFAFDECPSPLASSQYIKDSLKRTHNWAKNCLEVKKSEQAPLEVNSLKKKHRENKPLTGQALFGIVQGGRHKELRIESARFIGSLPFDGFGIGGEFGNEKKKMEQMLYWTLNELPEEKP